MLRSGEVLLALAAEQPGEQTALGLDTQSSIVLFRCPGQTGGGLHFEDLARDRVDLGVAAACHGQ